MTAAGLRKAPGKPASARPSGSALAKLIGDLAQLLGIDGQLLGAGDDDLTRDPPHLESPLGHHVFGFDRRPGDGGSKSLLPGRFNDIGGRDATRIVRSMISAIVTTPPSRWICSHNS